MKVYVSTAMEGITGVTHPEDAVLEQDAFDGETAQAAFDAVVELVELLRPYVERA